MTLEFCFLSFHIVYFVCFLIVPHTHITISHPCKFASEHRVHIDPVCTGQGSTFWCWSLWPYFVTEYLCIPGLQVESVDHTCAFVVWCRLYCEIYSAHLYHPACFLQSSLGPCTLLWQQTPVYLTCFHCQIEYKMSNSKTNACSHLMIVPCGVIFHKWVGPYLTADASDKGQKSVIGHGIRGQVQGRQQVWEST